MLHLIRNTFRYASRKYWDQLAKDLKPVYTAVNESAALEAFAELRGKWERSYPAIIKLWENAWSEFVPFLDYGACCRFVCGVRVCRSLVVGSIGCECWWAGGSGRLGCSVDLEEVERGRCQVEFAGRVGQTAA